MTAALENGNISHNERFIIATFYIGTGLDIEGLIKVFSACPGYDEEKQDTSWHSSPEKKEPQNTAAHPAPK